MWPNCDYYDQPRQFGRDVSNVEALRRGGAGGRIRLERDPLMRGMYHPRATGATPERKPAPTDLGGDYETPEKEAVSPRALSPKLEKRTSDKKEPVPVRNRKLSTPAKPPRGTSAGRRLDAKAERLPSSRDAYVEKDARPPTSSRDLLVRTPRHQSIEREEKAEVNPFRAELPEGGEGQAEEMWDCGIIMQPLSLGGSLPLVEKITPSLRNAFRFLTFHPCPPADWREAQGEGSVRSLEAFLPPQKAGTYFTLVLDLDETLMHCQKTGDPPDEQPDMFLHFTDSQTTGYVKFRPFARELLQNIASWGDLCEVVVFTASTQAYADAVLNVLDPQKNLVTHRLYRQHCVHANGGYFKDLCALGRNMDRIVLVDNSPVSLAMNPSNGIPIKSWLKNPADSQLRHLLELVKELVFRAEAVQPVLEERYNLRRFLESLRNTN
jgi:CTD small phosphatase-like protein 2